MDKLCRVLVVGNMTKVARPSNPNNDVKRYDFGAAAVPAYEYCETAEGEWVRYEDIKHLLRPASETNALHRETLERLFERAACDREFRREDVIAMCEQALGINSPALKANVRSPEQEEAMYRAHAERLMGR